MDVPLFSITDTTIEFPNRISRTRDKDTFSTMNIEIQAKTINLCIVYFHFKSINLEILCAV